MRIAVLKWRNTDVRGGKEWKESKSTEVMIYRNRKVQI